MIVSGNASSESEGVEMGWLTNTRYRTGHETEPSKAEQQDWLQKQAEGIYHANPVDTWPNMGCARTLAYRYQDDWEYFGNWPDWCKMEDCEIIVTALEKLATQDLLTKA